MNSAVKILTTSLVFLCLFVCASASTLSSAGVHGDSVLSSEETGPLYAIRTNLLVPALNIGAEVPIEIEEPKVEGGGFAPSVGE